jgi:hypothetical protein
MPAVAMTDHELDGAYFVRDILNNKAAEAKNAVNRKSENRRRPMKPIVVVSLCFVKISDNGYQIVLWRRPKRLP